MTVYLLYSTFTDPQAETMAANDDTLSDIKSTLSAIPTTTVLDQIEVELGLAGQPASTALENAPRPPKRRRNSESIEFIEVIFQKEGLRSAFYWQHGYEAEYQRPNKKRKKETY